MGNTPRVALLLIPFSGYDRGLLDGVARYCQLHGPWVFYLSGDDPQLPLPVAENLSGSLTSREYLSGLMRSSPLPDLRRWGATGVIGRIQSPAIARRILSARVPLIGIDFAAEQTAPESPLATASEIQADSRQAARLAAEHFLERGFRNFAYCGYHGRIWSQHREEGFAERLRAAGMTSHVYEPPDRRRGLSWDREEPAVRAWLEALPKPVGVMTCNDIRGRQVLEASLAAGLEVPDQVAVVGVDDDPLICNLSNPPLSSVALNLENAGYQAAELLDRLMNGSTTGPSRILAEARWVVARRSTDVVAIDDRHVSRALRFIRDQAQSPIAVADVVQRAGISRRGLEIRFQKAVGCSIRQHIQRTRIDKTKRLLVDTNLPAQRIAALAGFSSLAYLSNVFRREVGLTLAQYRRRTRIPC
jgi:LacI family transcriptional regulator